MPSTATLTRSLRADNDEMSGAFNFFSAFGSGRRPTSSPSGVSGTAPASPRTPLSNTTARTTGSNISGLTNSNGSQNRTAALLTLAEVANASSNETMNPIREEEECDARCHNECAGASDSEDEANEDGDSSFFMADGEDDAVISEPVAMVSDTANPDGRILWGAPPGWKIPGPPDEWKAKKLGKGEPKFDEVDNPGGWSPHAFQAKFDAAGKKGKCKCHALPTGCTPLSADKDGDREAKGCKFHCQPWKKEIT